VTTRFIGKSVPRDLCKSPIVPMSKDRERRRGILIEKLKKEANTQVSRVPPVMDILVKRMLILYSYLKELSI
jgi:hypothetical protein